ncbi:MAG: chemotaxis protein CheW [Polyangiaceae bacterium]|nr:chemotaxis protein CheW [Polyangiaceae bacterium]
MTDEASIDWRSVRERLAVTNVEDELLGRAASAQDAQRVLEERARLLARASRAPDESEAGVDVLVFALSGERYAIGVSYVCETIRSTGLTPVPGTPAWFLGVENIRGDIVAVVDLERLFGAGSPADHRDAGLLIVLGQTHGEFALRCDELVTVTVLPNARVLSTPRLSLSGERRHIVGMTADGILVIDGAALLEDERLVVEQAEET